MNLLRAHRHLTSWIAIVSVLLAALAPAVSHALGAQQAASWVEICSVTGAKWVLAAAADQAGDRAGNPAGDPAPAKVAHAFEHCPYCSLHAPALGMPPAALVLRLPSDLAGALPLAFLAAPRTLHAWAPAQARAPPALG